MRRNQTQRILVAPLDWGLGHATRCVPIIQELIDQKKEVMIASSGSALDLLQREFPSLPAFEIAGYHPKYPERWPLMLNLLWQIPTFLRAIRKEHRQIRQLVRDQQIDVIISDNRYGAWSREVTSVFITHQLRIRMPKGWRWVEPLIAFFNHRQIRKFDHCWVPDGPDSRLSGDLTRNSGVNATFIGPLSRMKRSASKEENDLLIVLSGPEPQRTILERKVLVQLERQSATWKLVRGLPSTTDSPADSRIINFLTSEPLEQIVNRSALIISRSGYSTIMDLAALGKKALLIPTPGQTEQQYLAEHFQKSGTCMSVSQDSIDLANALREAKNYAGFAEPSPPTNLLRGCLNQLLNSV